MRCELIQAKFVDYLDGSLRTTEYLCMHVHLTQCGPCRAALADLRELDSLARSVMRHPEPVHRWEELHRRMMRAPRPSRFAYRGPHPRRRPNLRRLGLAAAAVLVIIVAVPFVTAAPNEAPATPDAEPLRPARAVSQWVEEREQALTEEFGETRNRRIQIYTTSSPQGDTHAGF